MTTGYDWSGLPYDWSLDRVFDEPVGESVSHLFRPLTPDELVELGSSPAEVVAQQHLAAVLRDVLA